MLSVPLLMLSRPATMRSSVDLPQPDGPTRATSSPSATSKLAPATATWPFSYTFRSAASRTPAMIFPWATRRQIVYNRAQQGYVNVFHCTSRGWIGIRIREREAAALSPRFSLGCFDLRIPDRGIPTGRRRGAFHLAAILPHARYGARRPDGRRGLRSLPALQERRGPDARAGAQGLPLQHLLEPCAADGPRRSERRGPGFLRSVGR